MSLPRSRDAAPSPDHFPWAAELQAAMALAALPAGARLLLFGSWARGEARSYSDVDLALDVGAPAPLALLETLRQALEASSIPRPMDLIDLHAAPPALRDRILAEGRPWIA